MTHFTLTVCLNDDGLPELSRAARVGAAVLQSGIENRLKTALGRFDENKEMEPYRSYENGGPEDYWWVTSVRRGAESWQEFQAKGAKVLAAERISGHGAQMRDINRAAAMVDEQASEWEKDSTWAARLGEHPSWSDVVTLYNECYHDDAGEHLHVDENGRAYSLSTYNPDSKWDWYSVGGRWAGRFVFHPEHKDLVVHGERSWVNENDVIMPQHCDGGQKRALNLGAMRAEAGVKARETYAKYEAVVAGTPEALPWSTFTDNVSAGNGYTIDRAREEYHSQPRIAALGQSEEFLFADNEDYACGEKLFIERARARAVPGFALLTTDGRWVAPGEMDWFGASSDTEGSRINYWEVANAYIEALPDDAWLVSVDCHI